MTLWHPRVPLALLLALLAAAAPGRGGGAPSSSSDDSWRSSLHNLNAIMVNNQKLSNLLGPILNYQFSLPEVQLRRGALFTRQRVPAPSGRCRGRRHTWVVGTRTLGQQITYERPARECSQASTTRWQCSTVHVSVAERVQQGRGMAPPALQAWELPAPA